MLTHHFENILITGGLGFIGSNFLNFILNKNSIFKKIINIDKKSYYSNNFFVKDQPKKKYKFFQEDINNKENIIKLLKKFEIDLIVNFAAESHVDRSISNPSEFISSNINGTFQLLEATRKYLHDQKRIKDFKFIHISTDEVYGSLLLDEPPFNEENLYLPNSPYAASKASSDLLVRSYYQTYQIPTVITNCSNNYGPFQYPEKFIPLIINNCLNFIDIPIYGDGKQIRDWLHVDDHCNAILKVINSGEIGEKYNIGGNNEISNLDLVKKISEILDQIKPAKIGKYEDLISFVRDRPGHDKRYAIDINKIKKDLNWEPLIDIDSGIKKTIQWYLANSGWLSKSQNNDFKRWVEFNYKNR